MQKILYFDCFAGISGDMTVGALLDLGIAVQHFQEMLDSLNIEGYQVKIEKKEATGGILGTDFNIVVEEQHRHRYLRDITKIITESGIGEDAKRVSLEIFTRIAAAEAKVHGKRIDRIHFHEVGAIDSIVDIVGAAICMTMLNIDKVYASPLHVGSGLVECAHGILPVPAPATVEILSGVPVYSTSVRGELVTPTGAAIIRTLAAEFKPLPAMIIEKTGYGTGKKDFGIPNTLRVFMGVEEPQRTSYSHKLVMLETNIDDMNPEVYSYVVPLLLEKGALDVFLTGIIMKKGRPGTKLNVLCRTDDYTIFEDILFTETSTLGVRKSTIDRNCLDRKILEVETRFGMVKFKAAYREGKLLKIAPEYEECRRIALEKKLTLKEVYDILLIESSAVVKNSFEQYGG